MKVIVGVLGVLFLGWALLQDPAGAADLSKTIGSATWHLTTDVFSGLLSFLKSLFG